jgi:hypothetical protein
MQEFEPVLAFRLSKNEGRKKGIAAAATVLDFAGRATNATPYAVERAARKHRCGLPFCSLDNQEH